MIKLCAGQNSKDIISYDTLTHFQTTNLKTSKLKEFADDNFKFDENRKLPQRVENTGGKGEIARCKQFLFFPVFKRLVSQGRQNVSLCGKGLIQANSPFLTMFSTAMYL